MIVPKEKLSRLNSLEFPPKVEYSLTERGYSLPPVLKEMGHVERCLPPTSQPNAPRQYGLPACADRLPLFWYPAEGSDPKPRTARRPLDQDDPGQRLVRLRPHLWSGEGLLTREA